MGRKQSPFIGHRVQLVQDGKPILYNRYRDVAEILVSRHCCPQDGAGAKRPAEAAAAAPAANGHAQQANGDAQPPASKKRKQGAKQQDAKPQPQQQQPQPQPQPQQPPLDDDDAHAPEPEQQPLSRKELKKLKKQQRRQQGQQQQQQQQQGGGDADAAGTNAGADQQQQQQQQPDEGNAAEAARLRQVLGFTGGGAAQPAAAAAVAAAAAAKPAAAASGSGAFTFNFSALPAGGAADGDADAAAGDDDSARVAAATEAKLAAISAVTTADKDGYVPRRVFVGGMPYSYDQAAIEEYWGWCGAIEGLDMMTFPDTGRFRGIVFITFETQEGFEAALACNGETLDGQTLKVERCKAAAVAKQIKASLNPGRHQQQSAHNAAAPPPSTPGAAAGAAVGAGRSSSGAGAGPAKTPGYNVAYVGNIAFEARTEDISGLFEGCGVTKVRLHTDKDTRQSKGYAHVHFADEGGLDKALGMSGIDFMGRGIKVSYAQPKKA